MITLEYLASFKFLVVNTYKWQPWNKLSIYCSWEPPIKSLLRFNNILKLFWHKTILWFVIKDSQWKSKKLEKCM